MSQTIDALKKELQTNRGIRAIQSRSTTCSRSRKILTAQLQSKHARQVGESLFSTILGLGIQASWVEARECGWPHIAIRTPLGLYFPFPCKLEGCKFKVLDDNNRHFKKESLTQAEVINRIVKYC